MYREHAFAYGERDGAQLVHLPYQGTSLAMYVVLPEEGGVQSALQALAQEGMAYFDGMEIGPGRPPHTAEILPHIRRLAAGRPTGVGHDPLRQSGRGLFRHVCGRAALHRRTSSRMCASMWTNKARARRR